MPSTRSTHRLVRPALLLLAASLCGAQLPGVAAAPERHEPIRPIPPRTDLDQARVTLGERLFNDARLSTDNSISCATCHQLVRGGSDGLPFSPGVGGALGNINAPTIYNSSFNLAQFWDGRAVSLEEQAAGPIHNPIEMNSNWAEVLGKLRTDGGLVQAFNLSYDEGLTAATIQDAIATFERSLTTPNSPFDRFLAGDSDAIGEEAREGYRLFKSYGCVACHQGANVGGNMFQKLGTMGDYFADRQGVTPADLGRFNVTGDERDRHVFKVPSLRLVTLTPPYFHDASQETLEDAITTMARYQLGRTIADADVQLIIRFLEALVGENRELAP